MKPPALSDHSVVLPRIPPSLDPEVVDLHVTEPDPDLPDPRRWRTKPKGKTLAVADRIAAITDSRPHVASVLKHEADRVRECAWREDHHCASIACPNDQAQLAVRERLALERDLASVPTGWRVYQITITAPNDSIREGHRELVRARARLARRRSWAPVVGGLACFQAEPATTGDRRWTPHVHVAAWSPTDLDAGALADDYAEIVPHGSLDVTLVETLFVPGREGSGLARFQPLRGVRHEEAAAQGLRGVERRARRGLRLRASQAPSARPLREEAAVTASANIVATLASPSAETQRRERAPSSASAKSTSLRRKPAWLAPASVPQTEVTRAILVGWMASGMRPRGKQSAKCAEKQESDR